MRSKKPKSNIKLNFQPMPNSKNIDKHPLPDVSLWQPKDGATAVFQSALLERCRAAESLIQLKCRQEREMNLHNFDSGAGVEAIVRQELHDLLPKRYSVRSGIVTDRDGKTSGDCDVVVFNDSWFPYVKSGVTSDSRRYFHPVEGVYSICEIKQSLNISSLDDAMEKLVMCHRLNRPLTEANRMTENRSYDGCFHGLTNPLYSAIIATSISNGTTIEELANRFFDINKSLNRLEIVRALCVLGEGTVTWCYRAADYVRPALFMKDDLFHPIFPAFHKVPNCPSALYSLIFDLMNHLYHSILGPEDIAVAYGLEHPDIKFPVDHNHAILPDAEWMEKLSFTRDKNGSVVMR